jgi:hypothetical protein
MREVNVNMICWLIFCVIFMILNSDLYFTVNLLPSTHANLFLHISRIIAKSCEYNSSDCLIGSFWNFTSFLITI